MFLGEFQHNLDDKGRVILPAKFRDGLGHGAVIAKGRDKCLAVYPPDEWEAVATRTRELARGGPRERAAARSLFAGAMEVAPDKQGRVAIPNNLRVYAGLDREVVVTGAFTHVEIWNAQDWADRSADGDTELAVGEMPDLGI
ncbi:MAG TPA: division/cell wall cluster transcriptional repressor MraZ [Acidimicrobiia bacterium]|nr:division/cell wall cluster transcriptional repressor MraZ [Acidimicrobiia bacterium]